MDAMYPWTMDHAGHGGYRVPSRPSSRNDQYGRDPLLPSDNRLATEDLAHVGTRFTLASDLTTPGIDEGFNNPSPVPLNNGTDMNDADIDLHSKTSPIDHLALLECRMRDIHGEWIERLVRRDALPKFLFTTTSAVLFECAMKCLSNFLQRKLPSSIPECYALALLAQSLAQLDTAGRSIFNSRDILSEVLCLHHVIKHNQNDLIMFEKVFKALLPSHVDERSAWEAASSLSYPSEYEYWGWCRERDFVLICVEWIKSIEATLPFGFPDSMASTARQILRCDNFQQGILNTIYRTPQLSQGLSLNDYNTWNTPRELEMFLQSRISMTSQCHLSPRTPDQIQAQLYSRPDMLEDPQEQLTRIFDEHMGGKYWRDQYQAHVLQQNLSAHEQARLNQSSQYISIGSYHRPIRGQNDHQPALNAFLETSEPLQSFGNGPFAGNSSIHHSSHSDFQSEATTETRFTTPGGSNARSRTAPRFEHLPDGLDCPYCDTIIKGHDRITNMKRHMDEKHSDNPPRFDCECGKSFLRKWNLERHQKKASCRSSSSQTHTMRTGDDEDDELGIANERGSVISGVSASSVLAGRRA